MQVDRGGVARLLYKQIPVSPHILSVGFRTLFPLPAQFGPGDLSSGHINNIEGSRGTEIGA